MNPRYSPHVFSLCVCSKITVNLVYYIRNYFCEPKWTTHVARKFTKDLWGGSGAGGWERESCNLMGDYWETFCCGVAATQIVLSRDETAWAISHWCLFRTVGKSITVMNWAEFCSMWLSHLLENAWDIKMWLQFDSRLSNIMMKSQVSISLRRWEPNHPFLPILWAPWPIFWNSWARQPITNGVIESDYNFLFIMNMTLNDILCKIKTTIKKALNIIIIIVTFIK